MNEYMFTFDDGQGKTIKALYSGETACEIWEKIDKYGCHVYGSDNKVVLIDCKKL